MLKFLRTIAAPFFWIVYPMKIVGKRKFVKGKKSVIVMNHMSAVDPLLILKGLSLDVHFLSKKELANSKFKSWFMRKVNVISVDRENVSMDTMKKCLAVLKEGHTLGIYPEGTRNRKNRELQPLKSGCAMFALMGKAPIYPVIVHEKIRPFHRSYLMIGDPFELTEFYGQKPDKEILDAATERIREEMVKVQIELEEYAAADRKTRKKLEAERNGSVSA